MSINPNRIVTLKNGLRVANFSSPHPFTFTTGEVIPAVNDELSKQMSLICDEHVVRTSYLPRGGSVDHIEIEFRMSKEVQAEMKEWMKTFSFDLVDIVIVPLPVMQAAIRTDVVGKIINTPFRCIRVADRVTKTIHPDKFTV